MAQRDTESLPSALDYLRIIRRRKWWLIGSAVICTAAAFGYSYSETPRYTAVSSVEVTAMPSVTAENGVQSPLSAAAASTSTQVEVITSATIRDKVRKVYGRSASASAAAVGTSDVINISATATSPARAAGIANAYANDYAAFEASEVTTRIDGVEDQLQAKLNSLQPLIASYEHQLAGGSPSGGQTPPSTQVLQAQLLASLSNQEVVQGDLEQLKAASGSVTSPAQVVSTAAAPGSPSSPKTHRNMALGLGAGVVIGLALCVLLDAIDDRIRSRADIEVALDGIPVLGSIPTVPLWKKPDQAFVVSVSNPQSIAAESYRSLRTSLQFVLLDKGVKRVLVSSAIMGEGKTATAANLGVAMARAGNEVLAVSADLRRPRLGEFLGCDETVGLSSIALNSLVFDDAVRRVPGVPGLWFMGTGPIPPDPAEFLGSQSVAEIMATAADRFDLVLVDCAPVIPVADALAASNWSDVIILVVRANMTRRRHPRRALELLSSSRARICGAIFNDETSDAGGYKGYGYYGYYAYGSNGNGAQHRRVRKSDSSNGRSPSVPQGSASASDAS